MDFDDVEMNDHANNIKDDKLDNNKKIKNYN